MDDFIISEIPARQRAQPPIDEELAALFAYRAPKLDPMPGGDGDGAWPPAAFTAEGTGEPPNDHSGAMTISEYIEAEFAWGSGPAQVRSAASRNATRLIAALRDTGVGSSVGVSWQREPAPAPPMSAQVSDNATWAEVGQGLVCFVCTLLGVGSLALLVAVLVGR